MPSSSVLDAGVGVRRRVHARRRGGSVRSRTTSALETLDHVDGLVRRSMLIAEEDATTTRYRMLETIRQYAAERLEATGDAAETSRAHLDWCTAFVHEAGEQLSGPDDAAWVARMEREVDNIRTALRFAVSIGDLDAAQTLLASAPIGALWDNRLGASMAVPRERGRRRSWASRTIPSAPHCCRCSRSTRHFGSRATKRSSWPSERASRPVATTTGCGQDPGWPGCSRA